MDLWTREYCCDNNKEDIFVFNVQNKKEMWEDLLAYSKSEKYCEIRGDSVPNVHDMRNKYLLQTW